MNNVGTGLQFITIHKFIIISFLVRCVTLLPAIAGEMIPLTLSSPSLNRLVFFTSRRYSHSPFLCNFNSLPLIHRKLPYNQLLGVRCEASSSGSSSSSSFTAKPSKEIRKAARAEVAVDEKLSALRQQFSKPGVGIDAYIIPSQDAHQVWFSF